VVDDFRKLIEGIRTAVHFRFLRADRTDRHVRLLPRGASFFLSVLGMRRR
jgi:hypothetical protein